MDGCLGSPAFLRIGLKYQGVDVAGVDISRQYWVVKTSPLSLYSLGPIFCFQASCASNWFFKASTTASPILIVHRDFLVFGIGFGTILPLTETATFRIVIVLFLKSM